MRVILCVSLVAALPVSGVELSLVRTNITMPALRTFQMPVTASDAGGGSLTFKVVSIKPSKLTAKFAPASNRSLVLNVTGVDGASEEFTGDVVLQLFEDLTPLTTARIVDLVHSNFYDGQTIHRVVPDFVCQAGPTNETSGMTFDDEYHAELQYTGFGQLGMANAGDDSNDADFFITDLDLSVDSTNKPSPRHLTFNYSLFGQVTRGFDVLEKIMTTSVSNQTPDVAPIINSAVIINNSQDAVLRLLAPTTFTGNVAVTVSAMNAVGQTATQTLQVKIIANTFDEPPFMNPIPASHIITQYMAAAFVVGGTALDTDQLSLNLWDNATDFFPTNMLANFDPRASRVWLTPHTNVTGTLSLTIGIVDNPAKHAYDTQQFTIEVVPRSGTPTMTILPKSGSIVSSTVAKGDRFKATGTFTFQPGSDRTFEMRDVILLDLGDPGNPIKLNLRPTHPGRRTKNGVVNFKSQSGESPTVSAQFNAVKGTFKIALSNFDFPAAISNEVQVGINVGNDYGADTRMWIEKKPGQFSFPRP